MLLCSVKPVCMLEVMGLLCSDSPPVLGRKNWRGGVKEQKWEHHKYGEFALLAYGCI